MKKYLVGLLFVTFLSTISFAEDRFKLEGFNDITDNIKGYQITKADIIILGVEFYKTGSYYFRHCYKPMTLNSETANSFAIDFSGSSNWHNNTRREYFENEFKFSISFDLQLWPTADGRIYGARFIPTKVSNSSTTFKGKFIQYNYPTNSAYGDYITKKEVPESLIGPYEIKEVDYKKGFEAKCDSSAKYHDIPIALKPYAQNIIFIESRHLNEKSLNFECFTLDEDGNRKEKTTNMSIDFEVYAVLNSLTFADGTTKTFNSEKIDEKEWVSQNNRYDAAFPWEGKGTQDSPFLIKNAKDLIALNTDYKYIDSGYYFKQVSDITISNNDYWGKPQEKLLLYYYEKPFVGHYDGNGKSISGLKIITTDKEMNTVPNAPYNDYHGLFHRVKNAEIKNLTINCEIDIGENNIAGALAGEAINATFTNIIVNSKVNGKESIGGLVGEATNVSFSDLTVKSENIMGKKFVGGILGKGEKILADNINIERSTIKGDEYVGGAFGKLEKNCKLSNIFTEIELSAKKVCGGVTGSIKEYCSANGLSSSGKVTGETIVGGVFGEIYGNKNKDDKQDIYYDFVSKTEVTAIKGMAGGIVGEISENASLSDGINYGTVMGMSIGGIASSIGVFDRNAVWKTTTVARCENHGELKSTDIIKAYKSGGIAANLRMQNTIKDCYSDANITAKEECGGIVGYNDRGYIENCYAIGELKTEYYDSKVGGISGMFFAPTGPTSSKEYSTIKNCFITNETKFSFKGKPSDKKNGTQKCCSEEPTYKESYSNLQRFNSVSDIKLDSSWNPDVWSISPGTYPRIKRDVIGGVVHSYESTEEPQKENSSPLKPAETQHQNNNSEVKQAENNITQLEKTVESTMTDSVRTKEESVNKQSIDTKEYKPVNLKPFKTHPKVVVPEELELEP